MNKFSLIFLSMFTVVVHATTFNYFEKRAQKLQEFPPIDNGNSMYPDYTITYKKLTPSWWKRWFNNRTTFASQLKKLLKEATLINTQRTLDNKSIYQLICKPESHVYVWSNLHGGFHSLVRSLQWLHQENIIDKHLSIKKDNYIVFNGDVISFGPYSMDTLQLVLTLLIKNPDRCFYIRGPEESNQRWTNNSLKTELQIRASHISKESIPLYEECSAFFNTLPFAVYISTRASIPEYIRLSPYPKEGKTSISELYFTEKLTTPTQQELSVIHPAKLPEKALGHTIRALIKHEQKPPPQKSIELLPADKGSTSWSLFSSPIEIHQKIFDFHVDAFGKLTITNPLDKSTITLYQKKSNAQAFVPIITYYLVSGFPVSHANNTKTVNEFLIASTLSLEQGVPIMGQRTKQGIDLAIKYANEHEKIKDTVLRTIIYNDDYTPIKTRKNIIKFKNEYNAPIVLLPTGSPTLSAYLDMIKTKDVLVLFPVTGGSVFRDPELKGIVHMRGTYQDEVKALIDYLVVEANAKKFAFFYQDDSYGQDPVEIARKELQKKGITEWIDIPYQRNSIHYKKQAQKLRESLVDAIGFFSTAQATRDLIQEVGIDYFTNKLLFGISFLGEEFFRRFLEQHGLKILFGAVVPNPYTSQLPIVKEYRIAMDEAGYQYDVFSLEAYIGTRILIDALLKIDPPLTKEKILAVLESYKDYPFKGLTLTFNPKRRDFASSIWLESGKNAEWIEKKINSQEKKG